MQTERKRQEIKLRLMNENRRKKVETLREREQLREYRTRLQSMLMQKLVAKYGARGRNAATSQQNKIIKRVIHEFMKSNAKFDEGMLQQLELKVQEALQNEGEYSSSRPVSRSSGTGRNQENGGSTLNLETGNHGGTGRMGTPSIRQLVEVQGVNEWNLLATAKAVENEEKAKQEQLALKQRQAAFKEELDTQTRLTKEQRRRYGSTDDVEYLREQEKALLEWRKGQEAARKEIERKTREEKEAREAQIRAKKERQQRELERRRKHEIDDLERCRREIEAEQERIKREKAEEAERVRKVRIENMKDREIRQQRKLKEAEEDKRLMEEYKAKLEREEVERATAFQRRIEKLEQSGMKWAEEGAGREQMDNDRKLEEAILMEAKRKEQADLDREERDKATLREKQRKIAEVNRQLMEAKRNRFEQRKVEDMAFAVKFRREGEEYQKQEVVRRRAKMESMRQHQLSLQQQIDDRRRHPNDPMKLNMSDDERKINGELLRKLETHPDFLDKVSTRLLTPSTKAARAQKSTSPFA